MKGMEGLIAVEIKLGRARWRLVGVYINRDIEARLEGIKEWMEEKDTGGRTVVGRDFNGRTGGKGGGVKKDDWEIAGGDRKLRGKKINREEKILLSRIEEVGWEIFNGNVKGDEERDWTYRGARGESVIMWWGVERLRRR